MMNTSQPPRARTHCKYNELQLFHTKMKICMYLHKTHCTLIYISLTNLSRLLGNLFLKRKTTRVNLLDRVMSKVSTNMWGVLDQILISIAPKYLEHFFLITRCSKNWLLHEMCHLSQPYLSPIWESYPTFVHLSNKHFFVLDFSKSFKTATTLYL